MVLTTFILILAFILLDTVYAEGNTAGDYPYSKTVCEYLDATGELCKRELKKQWSAYTESSTSFFTNDELAKYANMFFVDIRALKNRQEAEYEEECNAIDKRKETDSITKADKKRLEGLRDMLELFHGAQLDFAKASYSTANTFSLGAISIATYPVGYFSDNKAVVTKSIVTEIEEQCEEELKMLEKYCEYFDDAMCTVDEVRCPRIRDSHNNMLQKLKDDKTCQHLPYEMTLLPETQLMERVQTMLFNSF